MQGHAGQWAVASTLRTLCSALALQTLLHLSRPAFEHQARHMCLEPCPLCRLQSNYARSLVGLDQTLVIKKTEVIRRGRH